MNVLFDIPEDVRDWIVFLNGSYLPMDEARVPVLDRGFLFGDGVYEVIPVYGRHPFRIAEHLRRLQYSLDGIRMANPHSDEEWHRLVLGLIDRCPHQDQTVYLQLTRGVARRDHAFPKGVRPTVFMMASALSTPTPELLAGGAAAVTAVDNRWLRCDIKSTALLGNVLMRQLAVDAGAHETVMIRDGFLTEGSASSVFAVRDGVILAPPKSHLVLPGTTYEVIVELAEAGGMPIEIRPVSEAELREADELWISSATREVLAVTRLDGKPVGSGAPGPVFQRMHAAFVAFRDALRRGSHA
ncbi:MAG: D-amino acid aminotransferase [Burkholderiales bacterium]|nr:D-amino acid aminotransferase [Burkholderiales bacterium]